MRRLAARASFAALLLPLLWMAGPASAIPFDPNTANWTKTWITFDQSLFEPSVMFMYGLNSEYELSDAFDFPEVGVDEGPGDNLTVTVRIPNFFDPLDTKKIRITVVGTNPEPFELPSVFQVTGFDTPFPGGGDEVAVPGSQMLTLDPYFVDDLLHWTEWWVIHPNPDWELVTLTIPLSFEVIGIHIDTTSLNLVPEPAALALVSVGLLGLTFAGRRRA